MSQILVAGIGNIFKGDDAFGVEVARRLAQSPLPAEVKVVDFGIRGMDSHLRAPGRLRRGNLGGYSEAGRGARYSVHRRA